MLRNSSPRGSDRRYRVVKKLIECGTIALYMDIFEYIPKSVIAKDCGFNSARINKLIKNPREWKVREVIWLSQLIGVDHYLLFRLIVEYGSQMRHYRPPGSGRTAQKRPKSFPIF